MRFLFVCAIPLVFIPAASAAGEYQSTKDGKTKVWNNAPRSGDEAAWLGDRDREGYATGFGTLSWYTGPKQSVKYLGVISDTRTPLYARYYGNMVRGKLNGPVNVHTKGKTSHAVFVDGVHASHWVAGRAPSSMAPAHVEVAKREVAAAPAEGPKALSAVKPRPEKKSEDDVGESLRALVGPPAFLRQNSSVTASSAGAKKEEVPHSDGGRLTKEEVSELADAEARGRGYNPAEYGRTEPQYNPEDRVWTISYKNVASDEMEGGKPFSVTIDDKTKGMVLVPSKN
jgi:hypothetical protein